MGFHYPILGQIINKRIKWLAFHLQNGIEMRFPSNKQLERESIIQYNYDDQIIGKLFTWQHH